MTLCSFAFYPVRVFDVLRLCVSKEDAFRREKYLKMGMGKRYLRNRLKGLREKL